MKKKLININNIKASKIFAKITLNLVNQEKPKSTKIKSKRLYGILENNDIKEDDYKNYLENKYIRLKN
ncbi:MAG: hypothetical protein DRG78_07040 [Epsilonproteobacteria bacterium]|nr:MAG: hypothetical protein DRG78_07040 [Campylobacterota bacterium]